MENAVNTNGRREKVPVELRHLLNLKKKKEEAFFILKNQFKVMNSIWFVSTAKENYEKTLSRLQTKTSSPNG